MRLIPGIRWNRSDRLWAAGVVLALLTGLLYLPILQQGFINYDDHQYVTENPHVASGLTWSGLAWSFQCGYAANWHPLTWISHMLDCSLYGLNPTGHHLTSLLLHIANTLLVFLLLEEMTGSFGRSFLVAALFGCHPLHVESVAWVAERKDVLSTLFWLLTLMLYARYVQKRSKAERREARGALTLPLSHPMGEGVRFVRRSLGEGGRTGEGTSHPSGHEGSTVPDSAPRPGIDRSWTLDYGLALLFFALGLMSKPMVVSLPFVLVLLDFWPLNRLGWLTPAPAAGGDGNAGNDAEAFPPPAPGNSLARLFREKVPFFALAFGVSVLTYLAQRAGRALWAGADLPLPARMANAVISYVRYLDKTFWPTDLALIYPYRHHWPGLLVVAALLFLISATSLFLLWAKRRPYLIVGWLWFLGTLVPVIGLVQVGGQAMADRYMYIPGIGLFLVIIWGLNDLFSAAPGLRHGRIVLSLGALAACLVFARIQLGYWHDGERVFRHTIEVTADNYIACNALGKAEEDLGRKELAFELYTRAVSLEPLYAPAQYNLGTALLERGRLEEAIGHFAQAVKADPHLAEAYHNWGKALMDQGKLEEAVGRFSEAVKRGPRDAQMRYSLGTALLKQLKDAEAIRQLEEALRLKPDYVEAHMNLGSVLMKQGKPDAGVAHFAAVVRLEPRNLEARMQLGLALLDMNRPGEAEAQFSEVLRVKPDDAQAQYQLATALIRQRKSEAAISHYREALRLQPDNGETLNALAWVLASDPEPGPGADQEAVQLAEKACQQTQYQEARFVVTLAAAYAQIGRFPDAVASAQTARDLATRVGEKDVAARAEELLELFASGRTVKAALDSGAGGRR